MQDVLHRPGRALLRNVYRRRRCLSVLLIYVLLAVAMTWPLAARLKTHLPGAGDDLWTHQWTFWWVKQSIIDRASPFYTNLLFHPHGVSLAYHNIAWLNIAAWLPLQAIVGSIAAYNLIFIAVFALNGFAMYLLARELTASEPAAFVGGLVYGFWPYTLSHYDHPNLIVVCWVPLALLYLRRTLKKGQVHDALLAALFLALTGLTRWHLLIMGGVIVSLYLLYKCLGEKACRTQRALRLLMLTGLLAGTLLAPFAAPMVVAQLTRTSPQDIFIDEQTSGQTDLLAYVLPSLRHPLWGDAISRFYDNFIVNKVYIAFLGYTAILLATYGAVKNWRGSRFWVLAAAVYIALALGPQLRINGQLYPQLPMPYRSVGDLFFIRVLRQPDRFNVFLGLPVGMLVSLGVKAILRRRPFDRKPALLVGMVGLLILGEYYPVPYPTMRPVTPAWYHQLAQEPGDFAILDLPMMLQVFNKRYMFYQITHGKPLVEGRVARLPREAFALLDSTPFLKELRQNNNMDPALVNVSYQLRPLVEADVRYIILHKRFPSSVHKQSTSSKELAAWQDWLTFDPCYEDTDLIVYRTEPLLGRDFDVAHDMTDDIGLIRASFTPANVTQAGLIQVDARWGSLAPPGRDYDVCLNLINAAGEVAQSLCEPLSQVWPTSRWGANEVVRSAYTMQASPYLEAGTYTVTLTLADNSTGMAIGGPVALGPLHIEASPRVFTAPRPRHPLRALWGDVILLHGYDLQLSAGSLELTLYWQAEQRMDVSYKVFVHLVDPTTGDIVAQDDAVPRRWTYPTAWWERGEVVEDTISLPLYEVPPGQYHLVLGLYDEKTGQRLPVYSAGGERYPDDTVPLHTVQH
jgi:hypothetical protein